MKCTDCGPDLNPCREKNWEILSIILDQKYFHAYQV